MPIRAGGRLVLAALTAGILLRLSHYAAARSLWIDEASLALNIGTRSYAALLRPLDYNQTAPLFFLWAERFMVRLLGMNELALRLLPFLASVGALLIVRRLSFRLLEPPAAALAVAVAAFSPALIEYSAELKPYSIDVLMCVLLMSLTVDVLKATGSERAWLRLLAAGAAAVLVSTAAPMVLLGSIVALVLAPQVRGTPRRMLLLGVLGVTWWIVFAAMYLAFYRAADTQYLHTVWRDNFLALGSPELSSRAWRALREVIWWTFHGGNSEASHSPGEDLLIDCFALTLLSFVGWGTMSVARRYGWAGAALLIGPAMATLAASAAGRYPVSLRLVLFTLPGLILLVAAGVSQASAAVLRRPWAFALTTACLLGPAVLFSILSLWAPPRFEDGRTVIRDLERRHRSGEPVYVFARGLTVWTFYTTDWSRPDMTRLDWLRQQGDLQGPAFENAAGRAGGFVADEEGRELVYDGQGRTELIGLSTGVQWLALAGFSQPTPDRGWATREFARIREAADPIVWLFFTHTIDGGHQELIRMVRARGGRQVYQHIRPGAVVYQFRFD